MPPQPAANNLDGLKRVIERHWGYRTFRPLQEEAMRAVLDGRDSVVVLPTGGGKSLCYQAPAVLRGDTTVVISPLIALMKDQVDTLQANDVPAIQINSSQTPEEQYAYKLDVQQGAIRLLFVSPERLVNTDFYQLLRRINVRTFAIDEAHCISHWGHDFRPEYRQLGRLKELFPGASVHAYTATATEQVRRDIIAQLGLSEPEVLVGNFDRPNLTYRVLPQHDVQKQTLEVLERHAGEAGIIYCLRRRDVDELANSLKKRGIKCLGYHAGMTAEQRASVQEEFAAERCDVIVATVAFGMGIDRSNVRYVLHTALPKSLEHYQQETGRAGRDGLEAECIMLYSYADTATFRSIIKKSAADAEMPVDPTYVETALKHLEAMDRYARGAVCRHKALVTYFDQSLDKDNCNACDVCLGDTEELSDACVTAQKILSCVARVNEGFGVGHVIKVLRGMNKDNIPKWGHQNLTTFGLLKDFSEAELRDWIFQLIGQHVLVQTEGDYPKLKLNAASWEVMRGQREVRLLQLVRRKKGDRVERSKTEVASWEGVDRGLFEELRGLRRTLAGERGCQPYMIFSDNTLRELAHVRPSTPERMHLVYGVGEAKLRDFGQTFLDRIGDYCGKQGLTQDNAPAPVAKPQAPVTTRPNPQRDLAFAQFREGATVEDVMHQTGRARTTVLDYLCEFVREEKPPSLRPWLAQDVYDRVAMAARQVGTDRLKPIFVQLGEQVPYEEIRLVLAHLTT